MDLYQSLVTVNPVTLIAQIANLFIQLLIVKIFFLDKIKAILDQRREAADKEITDAQAANAEAQAIKATYEQNMRDAKDNIEKILDMLVVGFEGQMDQLFKSESLDITSDIEVLEQMMNKDGLTGKDDFRIREEYTDEISDDLEEGGSARAVYGKEE
jgi:uncharacterized protein YqfA (UPF0365 family)